MVSCSQLCGNNLFIKCLDSEELCTILCQCTGCHQHTCHGCVQIEDYNKCWECDIVICNVAANDCAIAFQSCEHHYCEKWWCNKIGHRCECGNYGCCVACKSRECKSCGAYGKYGSQDEIGEFDDDDEASV
jgi:hypothetical protein